MKRLFAFAILLIVFAFSYCKKENPEPQVKEVKTVIVQMEVVNTTGYSVFYDQQVLK